MTRSSNKAARTLDARPDIQGDPEAKIASYNDAHQTAKDMGYPSLTEALEHLEELRATHPSGDARELADPQVVVAGKLLTIKPGAPEIALLCRAIFRASFADDEDEVLVNQKYQEWEEDQAKAIRAAHFVLRALGGNGSVVRALRATHSPSEAEVEADVARLVIAARELVFSDHRPVGAPATQAEVELIDLFDELDKASEAFASRVPWENEDDL